MNDEKNDLLPLSIGDLKRALRRVKEEYSKPATEERAGPVKIGSGIDVTEDGTASVDLSRLDDDAINAIAGKIVPKDEDVDAMLDEEFQPWTPDT